VIENAEHNRKIWGFHVSWNCQERKPALKRKCTISKKYLLSHVSDTHWGPYIIKSVPRYPKLKPSRDSARIGTASLCSRLGSRRFEMLMFDNRNTGMKISRRTDSNRSRTREFFFGYTHHAIIIHHSARLTLSCLVPQDASRSSVQSIVFLSSYFLLHSDFCGMQ